MLLGDSKKSMKLLDDFFAYGNAPVPFEINTSLRQMQLHYHFTKDITVKTMIKYMEDISDWLPLNK